MLNYRQGDATSPELEGAKIIAHVCDDGGRWQGSFSESLSRRWSEPEAAYRLWASQGRWQEDEGFGLGGIQLVRVSPDIQVANMIASRQADGTSETPALRYGALETCLHKLLRLALAAEASLHLPRLGTGASGGDWERIETMLGKMLHPVEVVVYDGSTVS